MGRLVVLASGTGTNLQAVIDACDDGRLPAQVVAVISDRRGAIALERAQRHQIPGVHLGVEPGEDRRAYDTRLADAVDGFRPDLVILAGWMRLLSMSFLGRNPGRVVNLHPALPGELPGTRAIERAWDQYLAGQRRASGVMVHLVPDEGVDDGPVLATEVVTIDPADTRESFADRMHAVERRVLVAAIARLLSQR